MSYLIFNLSSSLSLFFCLRSFSIMWLSFILTSGSQEKWLWAGFSMFSSYLYNNNYYLQFNLAIIKHFKFFKAEIFVAPLRHIDCSSDTLGSWVVAQFYEALLVVELVRLLELKVMQPRLKAKLASQVGIYLSEVVTIKFEQLLSWVIH